MTSVVPKPNAIPVPVRAALAVMVVVGLYDASVGLFMLLSPEPWQAHGPGTLWRALDGDFAQLTPAARDVWMSAFRRLGAFSLFAGMVSTFVAYDARHDTRRLLRFMILYAFAGLGFAWSDGTYFAGTPYHLVKQILGAAWVVAIGLLVWQSGPPWRAPPP